ncbi:chromosome segregation SMC family protein [Acidisphaera sp. L21]|uniref:chromosome segregation SMC family protein n=1 Tax=Acidisphaera sp. L21 TaxID=1641851 RepID=UPI00131C85AD|nr:AAA family ATPase [Acidisphaera sp. L21]
MPIAFSRLRIAGFKSFAEPQTVEILPGLTGVVGPNGCGKSNVVEALRWAMGESNARSLRGGEMDDVIFAGTAGRPSRNLAEVTLTLEEAAGAAPPPFHEANELQISRKIERGAGSAFRVNGKEVRARDVQTLFADLASGARSSAMVSQGRVGTIINARPDERRAVLEEAAGITGLHARRHEAELKLRAAESNLERAEDLRTQLDGQLAGLQKQVRQANRWRTLSTTVKESEAELLALAKARVELARAEAAQALATAQASVGQAAEAAANAAQQAADATASVPALRATEAEARTALERHRIVREQVAAEISRAKDALAAATARQNQVSRDLQHAEQVKADSDSASARLAAEETRLRDADAGSAEKIAAADGEVAAAKDAVREAEAAANTATERAAELTATSQALNQGLAQAEARAKRLSGQVAQLRGEKDRAAVGQVDPARVAEAAALATKTEAEAKQARETQDEAERARSRAGEAASLARQKDAVVATALSKLSAETSALAEVLGVKDGERWPPMVDALTVPPGLEAALGAVLGEELGGSADPTAARHWVELPDLAPAPLPGTPLGELVAGPVALRRALSGIGLVETDAEGDAKHPQLTAGQTLVSRAGAVWRWDGYTIRGGTPTAATVRLQQRNRLNGLRTKLAEAKASAAESTAARQAADQADKAAAAADAAARTARRDAEQRWERARTDSTRLATQSEAAGAKLAALDEQMARLAPEAAEADAALAAIQAERAKLPDLTMLRQTVDRARAALTTARSRDNAAEAALRDRNREAAARAARLKAIAAEIADWTLRASGAGGRVVDLRARAAEAIAEQARLEDGPATVATRAAEVTEALKTAELEHRRAADTLNVAVAAETKAATLARTTEAALSTARENVVRSEAAATQADHAWGTVAERILERLGANPALPPPPADLSQEAEEKARRRLERLTREREEMGPVNLRASIEAEEMEGRIAGITGEKEELGTAISKLRGSIGHINREGRERLTQVFAEVDRHFQTLFARMFGGGRAHLALVGSDDPLQAGLEIYAQPPGKKLATLSLLSGGEQALTALSLIFAVFRCNPAPVCVLDEVDAPLDDANVERFCSLLSEMVKDTGTRFLVVTHHHLTMARMDRLYGVTMQERGVSRLLSVDLARASEMVEQRVAAE